MQQELDGIKLQVRDKVTQTIKKKKEVQTSENDDVDNEEDDHLVSIKK